MLYPPRRYSRRAWDGAVRQWKLKVHAESRRLVGRGEGEGEQVDGVEDVQKKADRKGEVEEQGVKGELDYRTEVVEEEEGVREVEGAEGFWEVDSSEPQEEVLTTKEEREN